MIEHALARFARRPVLAVLGPGRVVVRHAEGRVLRAEPETGATGWRGLVPELGRLLESARGGTRRVHVVISDQWVRHCVIPAAVGLDRADEQIAYARHAWRVEFGAAVDQWRARVDIDAHGSGVAALIDDALAGAIAQACEGAGLRLDSLAPRFAAVQARIARKLAARRAWLCVLDAGHATLALRGEAGWTRLQGIRLDATRDPVPPLQACLDVEAAALGEGGAPARVDVVGPAAQLARMRFAPPWQACLWPDPLALD